MSSESEQWPDWPLPAGATVDVDRFPVHVDKDHHPLLVHPCPFPSENLGRKLLWEMLLPYTILPTTYFTNSSNVGIIPSLSSLTVYKQRGTEIFLFFFCLPLIHKDISNGVAYKNCQLISQIFPLWFRISFIKKNSKYRRGQKLK